MHNRTVIQLVFDATINDMIFEIVESRDGVECTIISQENVLDEITLAEFGKATGLDHESMELPLAWADFVDTKQRLPFAEWWARHQGEYA